MSVHIKVDFTADELPEINKTLNILQKMQNWRRGVEEYSNSDALMPYSPKEFGEAIDFAMSIVERAKLQIVVEVEFADDKPEED